MLIGWLFALLKNIIYYQITRLFEQKYRLTIPFAENNFGPFKHIVFIIVLFEFPSKNTILSVICKPVSSNLHLLSRYFHFLSDCELEVSKSQPEIRQKNVKTMRCLYPMTLKMPEMDSEGQIAPTRLSLAPSRARELLIGQLLRKVRARACKIRHLQKFKINISTRHIQTKCV